MSSVIVMRKRALALFINLMVALASLHVSAQEFNLEGLRPGHPRLLVDSARIAEINNLAETDTLLAELIRIVRNYADSALPEPVFKYEFDGPDDPRLKAQRRASMFRVYNCGMTYLLTGDTVYAYRAKLDLLAAADFPDWAPWHFLNVGEISALMGIGYDWLFDYLTEEEKKRIEQGILLHGLGPGIQAFDRQPGVEHWWVDQEHNINQVCSGGMSLAALAIAEASPDTVTRILNGALGSVPNAMLGYLPDGAWREGPTYWAYGTTYNGLLMAALRSATGSVFGMDAGEGYAALGKSGSYHIHTAGPTNLYFNFGDSKSTLYYSPVLFWLAREFNMPGYAWYERNTCINDLPRMRKGGLMDDDTLDRFLALLVAWYSDEGKELSHDDFPLDATFSGLDVALGAFHSEWSREAVYFGFKGGKAQASHSHMDIGSFVMDAKGERWAMDLGYGNNDQPGFSDYAGTRWTYHINSNLAHNTLSFWGMLQNKEAFVQVREFYSDPGWAYASIDMTESYRGIMRSCIRKYWFPERRSIEITDEIAPALPYIEARWAMVTSAEISLHGREALLRQNGKEFKATLLEPDSVDFVELATLPEDPGTDAHLYEGTTMLAIFVNQVEDHPFTIRVALSPCDTTLTDPGQTAVWESFALSSPRLNDCTPNPFTSQVMFSFDLPRENEVCLELYNLGGQLEERILEGARPAGRNVLNMNTDHLAPGVYVLKLRHGAGTESIRILKQ